MHNYLVILHIKAIKTNRTEEKSQDADLVNYLTFVVMFLLVHCSVMLL